MTRNKNTERVLERARQAKGRLTPVARRVKPLAGRTGRAALRGMHSGRVWAAPRVKRAGESLKDDVAPKVAAMMSSAADRIDPDQQRPERTSGSGVGARLRSAATRLRRRRESSAAGSPGTAPAARAVEPAASSEPASAADDADTEHEATVQAS